MRYRSYSDRMVKYSIISLVAIFMLPNTWAATLVVANKAEATASLINLESGAVVVTLPTGEGPHEVGISPDGQFAMVSNYGRRGSSGNSLTLINVSSASVIKTIDLGEFRKPHGVEWVDRDKVAVTVEGYQALIEVDVMQAKVTRVIKTDQEVSHMVALDPVRNRAYTSNMGSSSLTVIDLDSAVRLENIKTGKGAEGLAVSAREGHVWVTNRDEDTITVLDGNTLEPLKTFSSKGFPIRATATSKGQMLVTRARTGELVIYDASSFDEVRTVSFDFNSMGSEDRLFGDRFGDSSVPIGVVVDDAGERAFVAHANADVITEVDLESGEILRLLRAGREPDGMGYSSVDVKVP